jgi:small subunit ribosomal protein S7
MEKSTAFKYFMMQLTSLSLKQDAENIIRNMERCLTNVMPHVEVRSRRVGGATFKFNANSSRQKNFNGYEMVNSLFKKRKENQWQRLANECLAAAKRKCCC